MNQKPSPMNIIWLFLVVFGVVAAAFNGKMAILTKEIFESAKAAVVLAIALIGAMALWLGVMKVAEECGLMRAIARAIRPVMIRLFPNVPSEHPAMSAMIMNIAANMLGLGNAATPMGIKAMQELDKLNGEKGTATNAMCLFLAINTSSVTLLPLGVITVRAAAGCSRPADILLTTLFATTCSTVTAIIAAKLWARGCTDVPVTVTAEAGKEEQDKPDSSAQTALTKPGVAGRVVMTILILAFAVAAVLRLTDGNHAPFLSIAFVTSASNWLVPVILCLLLLLGYFKGVKVYETVTEGAKEGFNVAIRIIPFMVAIFVAIGIFRSSGAMDLLASALAPILGPIGFPSDVLPVALLRPLSGTGSFGAMSEIVNRAPDGFSSFLASTMQGSTETTFYVLAVYFGSVAIRRTRYAVPVGLLADFAGYAGALFVCHLLYR